MELLGLILRVALLVGLFIALRRVERWLHQHIFKVGWLATHNYQTTTILYYTFFLPGVVLHEVVYWLTAGVLNVRAEHSIQWPDAQEIGELKLNFVQISNRAAAWRKAIISISPLLAGIIATWFIAENILQITAAVAVMGSGELSAIAEGISVLTAAPNFWLWVYIIFTIANTMFPQIPKDLQGWRAMLLAAAAIFLALTVIGLGGEIFAVLSPTIDALIDTLLTTIIFLIVVDFVTVLILGTIEYMIERITGHSATFKGGKMYTMTREEAQEERRKERERERRRAERQRKAEEALPANVYALAFPIPGSPSEIPVTQLVTEEPSQEPRFSGSAVPEEEQDAAPTPTRPDDLAARIRMPKPHISTAGEDATEASEDEEPAAPTRPDFAAAIRRPTAPPQSTETDEEPADRPLAPTSFSRRPPLRLTDTENQTEPKSTENEEPARPAATRPPISLTPAQQAEQEQTEGETTPEPEQPAIPAVSRFGVRPPQPTNTEDDDDTDNKGEKLATPTTSRFGIRPPQPTSTQDDAVEDEVAEKESTWKRPAVKPFQSATPPPASDDDPTSDEDDDESLADMKPAAPKGVARPALSRFSARPFQPGKPEGDGEKEGETQSKSAAPRPTGFSSYVTPQPPKPRQNKFELDQEEDDDKPDAPRSSFRFGMTPLDRTTSPEADDDTKNTDEPQPEKPASSFGSSRPTIGASRPVFSEEDEDVYYEDEDEYYDEDDEEYLDYDDE